eukprot:6193707-Pleurochrysis_carterae.AAC.1
MTQGGIQTADAFIASDRFVASGPTCLFLGSAVDERSGECSSGRKESTRASGQAASQHSAAKT